MADFGLSTFVVPDVGGALPTWQWLAPEVIDPNSTSYDDRSDIYSYGIVLWEIVTAGMPFNEYNESPEYSKHQVDIDGEVHYYGDHHAIQAAIINCDLRPTIPSNCPIVLEELMLACWETNPNDRPRFPSIITVLELHIPESVRNRKKLDTFDNVIKFRNSLNQTIDQENELMNSITLSNVQTYIPDAIQFEFDFLGEIHQILVCGSDLWVGHQKGQISVFSLVS